MVQERLDPVRVDEISSPFDSNANEAVFIVSGQIECHGIHRTRNLVWGSNEHFHVKENRVRALFIPIPKQCVTALMDDGATFLSAKKGRLIHIASKLYVESEEIYPESTAIRFGLQWEIGGCLIRSARLKNLPAPAWLSEVFNYIEINIAFPVNLKEVAQVADVSPRRLSQAVIDHCGYSFREYIVRKRLDAACRLLINTNLNIGEIAHRTGFADHAHLTREFKKFIGVPPSEYLRES